MRPARAAAAAAAGNVRAPARERIDVGALVRGVLARVLHDEIHNLFAVPRVEPVVLQEELRGRVRVIATVERKLERGRALLDVDVEDEVVLDARVFLLPAASAADARDLPQSFPRRRRGGPRVRGDGPRRLLDHLSRAVGRARLRQRGRRFGLNLRLLLGESRARARLLRGGHRRLERRRRARVRLGRVRRPHARDTVRATRDDVRGTLRERRDGPHAPRVSNLAQARAVRRIPHAARVVLAPSHDASVRGGRHGVHQRGVSHEHGGGLAAVRPEPCGAVVRRGEEPDPGRGGEAANRVRVSAEDSRGFASLAVALPAANGVVGGAGEKSAGREREEGEDGGFVRLEGANARSGVEGPDLDALVHSAGDDRAGGEDRDGGDVEVVAGEFRDEGAGVGVPDDDALVAGAGDERAGREGRDGARGGVRERGHEGGVTDADGAGGVAVVADRLAPHADRLIAGTRCEDVGAAHHGGWSRRGEGDEETGGRVDVKFGSGHPRQR